MMMYRLYPYDVRILKQLDPGINKTCQTAVKTNKKGSLM